jgi:acyl dehydratase
MHAPAYVSDRLRVELSVLEKYERNGRPFIVFRHRVTRQEGEPVMDIDRTVCWKRKGDQ